MSQLKKIVVVDTNALWIRKFLEAMPACVNIQGLRIYNALSFPGGFPIGLRKAGRTEQVQQNWQDHWLAIPSWHKAFRLSTWIVLRRLRKLVRTCGRPDAFLFTLPWYASVAEKTNDSRKVYYAHDTFRFYSWNRETVVRLETRLVNTCSFSLAVAAKVLEDLKEGSTRPVHYFPMATSWLPFHRESRQQREKALEDLAKISRPRVGCVGQINESYDWNLLLRLSNDFPDAQFVFIGPMFKDAQNSTRIKEIFRRKNIHWLGAKAHNEIPDYLRQFDVCVNLLKVDDHNDRRSPLRLFDYLTTDRPVLSTGVTEAFNHQPHIKVALDHDDFSRILDETLKGGFPVDTCSRWKYVSKQTWEARVKQFEKLVDDSQEAHSGQALR